MRGIATVIAVGFVSILLFGIIAPTILEPIAEVFAADAAVQSSQINASGYVDRMLSSVLLWAPLLVLGSAVASAVVWYFRRERVGRRGL